MQISIATVYIIRVLEIIVEDETLASENCAGAVRASAVQRHRHRASTGKHGSGFDEWQHDSVVCSEGCSTCEQRTYRK